ncbi:MAG: tripartite tricarboxylate transporter substrate-binding protein [Pseudomonadota bacterium]|nr:tripartite tricarboxylate transporter substrate-binding protein [Pseudomonadota bacterium]
MIGNLFQRIAALAIAGAALTAGAQYPQRSVTLIVPFSAGGPTDTIGRLLAERMAKSLGQTVVVENVAGAGGTIANNRVKQAAPDGYTLAIGHLGTHVLAPAVQQLEVDYVADFEPIGLVATNPQVIVSKNDVPAKDLKGLVAHVKANPGKVSYGTGGPGTPSHVMAVYFGTQVGAPLNIVHYKGAGPAMQDVIAGHVDLSFDQAATAIGLVKAGRVRGYAVTAKSRLASAPDIPTVDEAGLPGFYMSIWHALWVPRGTPREVTAKLNEALREALADSGVRKRLTDMGQEIPAPEQLAPEALRVHHRAETEKWWPVIKAAGIKAQ